MSFLNPNFLWALFAVAVPIIIHLINFRKYKTVYFSNIAFLKNIKNQTQTRTKLKQILILISRILMIAMLVFAFAGPYIPSNNSKNGENSSLIIIYVDNSFSMQAESQGGQNFEQAKNIAKQIINNANENMRFALITNDNKPENQTIIDKKTIIKELDKTKISPKFLSISDIFLKANTLNKNNEIADFFIISDNQKSLFTEEKINNAENLKTIFIPLQTQNVNNIFIDTCFFETPIHKLNQKENLKVKVVNKSNDDIVDLPLQLYLNGTLKVMSSCNLLANEEKTIDIEFVNTISGEINGQLAISDFPITYDNELFFNFFVSDFTNVLIINENTNNKYLTALFESNNEDFLLKQNSIKNLQTAEFEKYDLIILNGITEIFSGLSSDLQNFISNGASLVYIPPEDFNADKTNSFVNVFGVGQFEQNSIQNSKIFEIDYNNEIFKNVFQKYEKQSDLPNIGIFRKFTLLNRTNFSKILSTDKGFPLFLSGNFKQGKFYLFTFPFNENNKDFLKSSLFVPIMLNIALNSSINTEIYATIINNSTITIFPKNKINNYEVFSLSNNIFEVFTNFRLIGNSLNISIPDQIEHAGKYYLLDINKDTITSISLNYNRTESYFDYLDKQNLEKYIINNINGDAKIVSTISKDINSQLKEISFGTQFWQIFIILAILFLICELLFIKFLK